MLKQPKQPPMHKGITFTGENNGKPFKVKVSPEEGQSYADAIVQQVSDILVRKRLRMYLGV